MKIIKRAASLVLCLLTALIWTAEAGVFVLPRDILTLESGALGGVNASDGVFLPPGLVYAAPDAFEDTPIYGFEGSYAQSYAEARGLEFISVDIGEISIDVPPYVSPYRPFEIGVNAESMLGYEAVFQLYKDGTLCFETGSAAGGRAEAVLYEGGLYDYKVILSNQFTSAEAYFEGETEVYAPVGLVKDHWLVRGGEGFCRVGAGEGREVE